MLICRIKFLITIITLTHYIIFFIMGFINCPLINQCNTLLLRCLALRWTHRKTKQKVTSCSMFLIWCLCFSLCKILISKFFIFTQTTFLIPLIEIVAWMMAVLIGLIVLSKGTSVCDRQGLGLQQPTFWFSVCCVTTVHHWATQPIPVLHIL